MSTWGKTVSGFHPVFVFLFSIGADLFARHLPEALESYPPSEDGLLNAIYAGMIYGVGSGLIYRAGGSMGGTSVPARIIQKHTGFALSQSYLFTDLPIILAAGFVFTWERSMLALLTLILGGIVGDFVLEGSSQVRTAMIVTEKPGVLGGALMQELRRGVSSRPITGACTETTHTMLYCPVRRSQIYDLR
ncbi:MAG: YitT family protein [Thermodesulfobacteriota bacterium]